MAVERLVVSNFQTGLETGLKPFLIENDAFPSLTDAYIFRGRVIRKRGTQLLGRLQVNLTNQSLGSTDGSGNFTGNIFAIIGTILTLTPNASMAQGTIRITIGAQVFTESTIAPGTLVNGGGGTGTINYSTGDLTIVTNPSLIATPISINFGYYPNAPVLGLEDFEIGLTDEPILIGFDNFFSYGFNQGNNQFYNTNFYKSTGNKFNWQGPDYDQFFSTNYLGITTIADNPDKSGCLWATNNNPGMKFITITNVTLAGVGAAVVATITTSANHGLANTDFVFINEVSGITNNAPSSFAGNPGLNGQSGQVTVTGANTFTISAPFATGAYISGGIVQYLTQMPGAGQDGIRWYDGDPTVSTNFGWVNFAPPLTQYDPVNNPTPQYLVGAKIIIPFKGRLLFCGVYLRTSQNSPGIQYFPNRVIYSQVGSPFYASPLPFPLNGQTPSPSAYYSNVPGAGGFITAPLDQEVITVNVNEDILIFGFEGRPLKLISTGDDILPFIFQTISSEYGAFSTFSAIPLDVGVLYIGDYGAVMVTPNSAQRIDLRIPDQTLEIAKDNNKLFRVTAVRDFQKELIYFTYVLAGGVTSNYPNQTLLYSYREQTWAIINENYTHYGTFRRTTNRTWNTLGAEYGTWSNWTDPWNIGLNDAFFPQIIGGNQQGFVMDKGVGTHEDNSQYIASISVSGTVTTITSPNHCLNNGDFIQINSALGLSNINGNIFQITVVDQNNFSIQIAASGTYGGGGIYKRYNRPSIFTKQFPIHWKDGRGARIGLQRYLFDTTAAPTDTFTDSPQVTVNIYVSQNANTASNDPNANGYLAYSNIVLTCPEPSNLFSQGQSQTWHRMSNSFNGDSVQIGITLSDSQIQDPDINEEEIALHALVLDLYPGPVLA